jgi:DNA-directed RNA polymerase specialized sigma24 family protein
MTGSVIDGEDVLQDALIKAVESLASAGEIGNSRGWLFRLQLRQLAAEPEDLPHPVISEADRERLGAYVAHFNARDFDAIRAMIGCRRARWHEPTSSANLPK